MGRKVIGANDRKSQSMRIRRVAAPCAQLYRNTTTDWIRLRWVDGTREGVTTQGHHFLDAWGAFPTTPEMTLTGSATVVLASGALTQVTAGRTPFCADVAPRVERGMGRGGGLGRAPGTVGERDGWASGAVEGEGVRGYGAGGVMGGLPNHNDTWVCQNLAGAGGC